LVETVAVKKNAVMPNRTRRTFSPESRAEAIKLERMIRRQA
jgi:hypothetical protein